MAARAAPRSIEIKTAGLNVAGCQIGGIHCAPSSAKLFELHFLAMNESDDIVKIRIVELKRRHPFIRAACAKQRTDLVATCVRGNKFRACEVGASLASGGITAMAKATLRCEPQLAGLNLLDRIGLQSRCFWRRPRGGTLPAGFGWNRGLGLGGGLAAGSLGNHTARGHHGERQNPDGSSRH